MHPTLSELRTARAIIEGAHVAPTPAILLALALLLPQNNHRPVVDFEAQRRIDAAAVL